jgi:O-methyltransferase involved in polyketide biosynthesis
MDEKTINKISNISETLLIPLYSRALESKTENPLITDNKAIEITEELNKIFEKSNSSLYQNLAKGKSRKRNSKKLNVAMALRTRKFDRYCRSFLEENPNGTIVELGCGLSTRYSRIKNDTITWYDLDFPEVIDIRKEFFKESDRYHFIPSSVLDYGWMENIKEKNNKILFIAEGLLMYLHENEVKKLLLNMQKSFPGCYLACEVVHSYLVKVLKRKMWRKKFQRDFGFGEDTSFYFGIKESKDFEDWNQGITLLEEWTYFDDKEKKMGWMNILGKSKKLSKTQWTVYYQLKKV